MPFIILGDPSQSMMRPGREFFSMGAPGQVEAEAVPVMMAVKRDNGDAFNRRVHRGSPRQLHAFRPEMFLIAEPGQAAANPMPAQPRSFEAPMGQDFFSDTFGQEMALSMQNMERDMQD
jgi:hypothetical protein